jgi:hypothetical protein
MSRNKIAPDKPIKIYNCYVCDYNTYQNGDYNKHLLTRKHERRVMEISGNKMEINGNKKSSSDDNARHFCQKCNYSTNLSSDFAKHEASAKHINANITNKLVCTTCNICFKTASGIWKHKKKCKPIVTSESVPVLTNPGEQENPSTAFICEMFKEMMKSNKEMQNMFLEQNTKLFEIAKQNSTTHQSNNTNSLNTNNQFNLNFFLNETCKDAVNLTDFINSLQVQVEDFETTGRLGYVEGISRIIMNGIKNMDVNKRPIHCTDVKRETVYVKDQDLWEKENPEKEKLRKAVNRVAQMNLNQLQQWQKLNPDCVNNNTKENNEYIHLSLTALGGETQEQEEKYMDKIMKNVLREVVVDKNKV